MPDSHPTALCLGCLGGGSALATPPTLPGFSSWSLSRERGGAGPGLRWVPRRGQRAQLLPGQGWVSRGWRRLGAGVKCIAAFLLLLLLAWQPAAPGRRFPWPCCNSIKWGQRHPKLLRGGISSPRSGSEGWQGTRDTWPTQVVGHHPTAGMGLPGPGLPRGSPNPRDPWLPLGTSGAGSLRGLGTQWPP